jgi:hypothetical protein
MKFSDHLLIEETFDDANYELIEEGIKELTTTIRKYIDTVKSLKVKSSSVSSKNLKDLYNSEQLKYKKHLEYYPGLIKYFGPIVKDVNKRIEENGALDPNLLKYVTMTAINLIIQCTVEANLYLIKTASAPKIMVNYSGATMSAITGISNLLFNIIDAQTTTELIASAVNIVKSIPSMAKKSKESAEKYAKSIKDSVQ